MRRLSAVFPAAEVFVVTALILMLIGAFCLRLILGVSTYRSSGAWIPAMILSLLAAAVLGVLTFRSVTRRDG